MLSYTCGKNCISLLHRSELCSITRLNYLPFYNLKKGPSRVELKSFASVSSGAWSKGNDTWLSWPTTTPVPGLCLRTQNMHSPNLLSQFNQSLFTLLVTFYTFSLTMINGRGEILMYTMYTLRVRVKIFLNIH